MILIVALTAVTAWTQPRATTKATMHDTVQQSILGLALLAAFDAPQENSKPKFSARSPESLATGLPKGKENIVRQADTSATKPVPLLTRWFKTGDRLPQALSDLGFRGGLSTEAPNAASSTSSSVEQLREFVGALGIDLSPPKALFLSERAGFLMVRATAADLENLEQALQILIRSPPQVVIEAQWCEVDQETAHTLGLVEILIKGPGILTAPQFGVVRRALEQHPESKMITLPRVTTLTGRQAQIKTEDVATNRFLSIITEPPKLGLVLDVLPDGFGDDYTLEMTVIAHIKDFLGYEEKSLTAQGRPIPVFGGGESLKSAVVWDGQTLVLPGGEILEDGKMIGQNGKRTFPQPVLNFWSRPMSKQLLIFITPTLIDPAGNRVHGEEDMPFSQNAIPAQPAPQPFGGTDPAGNIIPPKHTER